MKSDFKYKAFISYSHEDSKWANWLHRRIESYRPPKQIVGEVTTHGPVPKRLTPVFRDRAELPTASDLSELINAALEQSSCLIVICSPAAARSQWVNEEILAFKRQGREHRILCLIVAGEPNATERPELGLEECFPEALRYKFGVDGGLSDVRAEPIAADVREGKDSKTDAKLKIIAGMIGVGFDALKQREQQSRQRRLAAIASAATVGMIIATTLATVAFFARAEAERQSVRATAEAQTAQRVTDFLVDLFDASDPFGESRADFTVRDLLDRGSDKIQNDLAHEPRLQARLLTTIGEVHTQLGFFDDARTFLDEAYETQTSILDPNDVQILRTQIRRAWLAVETGNYDRAQTIYDAILPPLDEGQLYSDVLEPTDEWVTAVNDLGVLQWSINDLKSAKSSLAQALTMGEDLYGADSLEIATTLNNLALAFAYSVEFESARPLYERAISIRENIQGPDHPALSHVIMNLASTVRSMGDFEAAQSLLERGLRIAKASLEPDHPTFANLNNGLGIVLWKQGDYAGALERLEHAGQLYVTAYGETGPGVGNNLQHQARVFHSMGDLKQSKLLYERAAEASGAYGPGTASELAEVLEKLGDIDGAHKHHQLAIELASKMFDATNPYLMRQVKGYEEFLQRNGLEPQASTLILE